MRKFRTIGPIVVAIGVMTFLPASAQIKNFQLVVPAKDNDPATAAAVAINHKVPGNWVAGTGPHRTVYTRDAGKTWISSKSASTMTYQGDAALIADAKGNIHYAYTAGPGPKEKEEIAGDRVVSRFSAEGGSIWEPETFFGSPSSYRLVRPRLGMFRGTLFLTWTRFDRDPPKDSACRSHLFFSMSSNEGKKWSDAIQINELPGDCVGEAGTLQGAAPVVNPEEKLFVAWANQGVIYMDRSYDGGKKWLGTDLAIARRSGGGVINVPGMTTSYTTPVLVVDNSPSYFRGSLYMVWADQGKGDNDADIWFARSTNRGDFWSQPSRINQDSLGKHQFLPSMAVDEATGILYAVYYDRRGHDDLQTDVYLAYSVDGGNKFTELKISETSFAPSDGKPFTGHTAIAAFKGEIVPVWTRPETDGDGLWTAPLKQGDIIKKEDVPRLQNLQQLQQRRRQ